MLLSRALKLVAAFNHQHIFIDPNPDTEQSFQERQRLFNTPKTTWADYDKNLISQGGGIFNRSAKAIAISEPMRALFAISATSLTPHELIHALLKAPVDLIWNGGIGTYVKASMETHSDVGDKANDALRVNASELRCKVFGEGGNLGMTQRSRIEYCLNGGGCNTDFIDNAGGVDCSDHEVNIKILLNELLEQGDLTLKQRNQLLVDMTEDVAKLVLQNNYRQTLAISVAQSEALRRGAEYRRFMQWLQVQGRLSRTLEYLPEDDVLLERQALGKSLTRPELAILISYAKAMLKEDLAQANIAEDDYIARFMESAFPPQIVKGFSAALGQHRLRREIIATQVANDMVNTMGISFAQRLMESTGASVGDVAKAYVIAREIYGVSDVYRLLEEQPASLPGDQEIHLVNALMRKVRRAARWFLRNRRGQLHVTAEIDHFVQGIRAVQQYLPPFLSDVAAEEWSSSSQRYQAMGLPESLIFSLTAPANIYSGLSVVEAARISGRNLEDIAQLYFTLGNYLNLPWFYTQISELAVENNWHAMARETFLSDLESQLRNLTIALVCFVNQDSSLEVVLEKWSSQHSLLISRWNLMVSELKSASSSDYAIFSVALRDLLDLSQATQHCALLNSDS
jgi:glutamate dehydrogenase